MEQNAKIYIAGHSGLIGSAMVRKLWSCGYTNIITRTHTEMDLTERKKVKEFFERENPQYVFLAAAKVGGIFANNACPAEFIYENLMIQTNVIDLSYRHGVKKLLFFGSSCVFPKMCQQPMKEEYLMTGPLEPTNEPFGVAKLAGMKMCQAYDRQYGTNFISIIPANVYGINDHFSDEGHVVASLIKKFHEARVNREESVILWGTGKPKREFPYMEDAAEGILLASEKYNKPDPVNLGAGFEISIKDLGALIAKLTGFKGRVIWDTTKPDGQPRRCLDVSKAEREFGFRAKAGFKEGLRRTIEWYKKNPR